jgi:type VI secretion system secreted protein VgrG
MSHFISTRIMVDGKELTPVSSFHVSQSIYQHHSFRITCPSEAVDGHSGLLQHSQNLIGSKVTIQTRDLNSDQKVEFNFAGVITQVEGVHHAGDIGEVVISGFSPTILLDDGPICHSWLEKPLKAIFSDVVSMAPSNLLSPMIGPTYTQQLDYTVQYWETGWEFLCRLGATFGEWIFYDGEKLVIGEPKKKAQKKTYNLDSFNLSLQVRPLNIKGVGYDLKSKDRFEVQHNGKSEVGGWGSIAAEKSMKFYGSKPSSQWHNQFVGSRDEMTAFVKARAGAQGSNMARLSGSSRDGDLQVGTIAHLSGYSVTGSDWNALGDFLIVSIDHQCDEHVGYINHFTAIPASCKIPPIPFFREAHCEPQNAVVIDTNDPDGLGRVRVHFFWMGMDEKSTWIRIASMHAGSGRGSFFIPEVNEEVMVAFEGNNPSKPFILGTVYNGKDKPPESAGEANDIKVLRTRSGNRIVMNDKEGSLTLVDQKDNKVQIDGSGNIKVTSTESIVLTCGSSSISLKKDGTIEISGKDITIKADQKAEMKSGPASFSADGAGGDIKVKGTTASVEGSTTTEVKGGTQTNVSASGQVAVKGAMIMLN